MPVYLYRAVDLERRQAVEGTIEAEDDREARAALRARGVMPLAVEGQAVEAEAQADPLRDALQALTFRPVPPLELAVFARQLASMLDAGMPLVQGIELLEGQTSSPTLREALAAVRHDLLGGHMLSDAVARHPKVFPPMMIQLTRVGELSGELGLMYGRFGDMLENELEIRRKVRGALTYPALVLVVLGGVVAVLLGFVVPTFAGLFAKASADLPLATKGLIALSAAIRVGWPFFVLAALVGGLAYRWWRRTPQGRPIVDRLWLRLPVIGPLLRDQAANTFARAFGTMYGAGVPVVPALASCRELIENAVMADLVAKAEAEVAAGNPLAEQLQGSPYFPPILAHMLAIGEATGRLEDMTARAVGFSDREIDHKVRQMTTLLEPLLTLLIGAIVMFVALALYLPLFDLPKIMSRG
jgi:type II secretory pathway component PulF